LTSLVASLAYTISESQGQPEKHSLDLIPSSELGAVGHPTDHRETTANRSIDLEPLKLPLGTSLRLQFEASDNNDVSGPSIGRSTEFFLRVVGEAEFRSDLLRREKAERQELERLWKAQDDLVTESRALAAAAKISGRPDATRLEPLPAIYRGQKQVATKLVGLADRIAALATEIEYNRLPDPGGTLQSRLTTRIVDPLRGLASDNLPLLIKELDHVRLHDQTGANLTLTRAIADQETIANGIKRVLEQMLTSEGYQEAIDLLYQIQKAQTDVYEQTNKAREEQIKRILEGRK